MGLRRFNALSGPGIHPLVTTRAATRPDSADASADAALVERARTGDADAREQLVRRYLPDVYRTTVRVLGDADLAQDAAQDALVNAMGGLARFRGDASFRTWLLRIAINAARSVGRRNGRRREVSLVLAENEPTRVPDPARQAVNTTELERAERALARLPPKQRVAVALRVQQGLSYAEIADSLDCSEGAARVNYHLGVKRLRELLR
jgi:RNA polymerase sigma-70 factor (ECF subfamily)